VTLEFETLETVEMFENRVNGRAQGGTAKGIRLVAPATCNQENDQSLRQKRKTASDWLCWMHQPPFSPTKSAILSNRYWAT